MPKKRKKNLKPKFKINLKKRENKSQDSHNILTYWLALTVLLVCNFAISIVLIPFLMVLEKGALYLILIIFGLMFGSLFKLTLSSIEGLDQKHHTIAKFFIPSIAIINVAVITTITNRLDILLKLYITHNPSLLGIIYALSFLLPFTFEPLLKIINKITKI